MAKRILTILLCAALVFSLGACGEQKKSPESENTSWADFVQVMTAFKERGDQTSEMGLPVESEFFYSYAGASVSAFRYAVEYVLWLKGEGSTLAEFTADSPYCGWETIAEINYSSSAKRRSPLADRSDGRQEALPNGGLNALFNRFKKYY